MERIKGFLSKLNKPLILVNVLIVIFYIILLDRFPAMWNDEADFSNPAFNIINGKGLISTIYPGVLGYNIIDFDKPPVYYFLLALDYALFGTGVVQGRLSSVLFAVIGVNVFYFLGRQFFNKRTSLIVTILFGTVPIYFITAREIRMEIEYVVFNLICFYCIVRYFKTERKLNRYIILAGIFASLSLLTHEIGIINIVAIIFCIVFFNIKISFKDIFSKHLIQEIKKNLKIILLFCVVVVLVAMPYIIFVLMNFTLWYTESSSFYLYSAGMIIDNILNEYLQYEGLVGSFSGKTMPAIYRGIIILVVLAFLALSLISLLVRSYDDDYIRIALVYAVISAVLLMLLVYHKSDLYINTFMPQVMLGFGVFLERKKSLYTGLHGWYLSFIKIMDNIKSLFQKNTFKKVSIPLLIIVAFIGINISANSERIYENRNCDPNIIRNELFAINASSNLDLNTSTDVLVGDSCFWLSLTEFTFYDYSTFYSRMDLNNQSFESILFDLRPTILIVDKHWLSLGTVSNPTDPFVKAQVQMVADFNDYIAANCTYLGTATVPADGSSFYQAYFPVQIYSTNFR
jgi:hypothetical protein